MRFPRSPPPPPVTPPNVIEESILELTPSINVEPFTVVDDEVDNDNDNDADAVEEEEGEGEEGEEGDCCVSTDLKFPSASSTTTAQ